MLNAVRKEMRQKFDIVILAAAVSDYALEKPSKTKIKSDYKKIILRLKRVPKIINEIKKIQKDVFLVGFKAETNISKEKLIKVAKEKFKESNADLIIANDIGSRYQKNTDYNNVIIIDSQKAIQSGWKTKQKIAKFLRNQIEKRFSVIS